MSVRETFKVTISTGRAIVICALLLGAFNLAPFVATADERQVPPAPPLPRIPQPSNFSIGAFDEDMKPIGGAFVRMSRDDGAGTILITDRNGLGQTWLAGGTYIVTVSRRGFQTVRAVITTEVASNGRPAHPASMTLVMKRQLMSEEEDAAACGGLLNPAQTSTLYVACGWPPATAQ
jgi:hypothetical protein